MELVLRPAPLRSTGAACYQGRLLPGAARGPIRCVCLRLQVRACQRRLRRLRRFFFCCCRLFPGLLPFDPSLLPPYPWDPCPWPSYLPLAQAQNGPHRNKLCDRVLPPGDQCPNLHDPCLLHRPHQGRLKPLPITPLERLYPR